MNDKLTELISAGKIKTTVIDRSEDWPLSMEKVSCSRYWKPMELSFLENRDDVIAIVKCKDGILVVWSNE